MSRKKVLFLTKWYPHYKDPLDGIFTVDHAKAVAKKNDVFVLFIHSSDEIEEKRKVIIEESEGLTEMTIYFKMKRWGFGPIDGIRTGLKYIGVQFGAYKYVQENFGNPDIVHVHTMLRATLLALKLKRKFKIPYVITEHWSGYDPNSEQHIGGIKKKMTRFFLKRAAAVTTVSSYLGDQLKKIDNSIPYHVVSNTIDESLFKPSEVARVSEKKRLLHISTLSSDPKNFDKIVEVIAEVYKVRQDFELHAVGKGEERAIHEALADKLGVLNKAIFFHGYLEKEQVAEQLNLADLFVLFSRNETQSCVLLESFLSGTPAIVPNVGGSKEIISDINGVLVERNDTEQLKTILLNYLDDKYQFDPQGIRKEALQYGYEAIGEEFDVVYDSVLMAK
jgi:glycosyltransferase involved in cell wall biosynthesis